MYARQGNLVFGAFVVATVMSAIALLLCPKNVSGEETQSDKDAIIARFLSKEISDCTIKLDGNFILDFAQIKTHTNNVIDGVVTLPFAKEPDMARVNVDMLVKLDLSQYSDFIVDYKVKRLLPDLDRRITLYFRNSAKWYRLEPSIEYMNNDGSVRIRYRVPESELAKKESLKIEEIRLSFWNRENLGDNAIGRDTSIQVGKMLAFTAKQMSQPNILFARQCRSVLGIGCFVPEEAAKRTAINASKTVDELLKQGWTCQTLGNLFDVMLSSKGVVTDARNELYLRFTNDIKGIQSVLITDYINSREQFSSHPKSEMRLVWENPGDTNYGGDWDKKIGELVAAGFNGIIVRVQTGGEACYDSDILPHDIAVKGGYHLDAIMKAAKKHGIDVHAWKINYQCRNLETDFVRKMRQEGRLQKAFDGSEMIYNRVMLCPSDPRNRKLEVDTFIEMATKYPDLKGIHYDYIRYLTSDFCYCEGCRDRFNAFYKEKTGKIVEKWPEDTRNNPEVNKYFIPWRAEQITILVRDVRNAFREKFPKMQISAAVQQYWPSVVKMIGQNWISWGKEGLVDFVCPMTYIGNLEWFQQTNKFLLEQMGGAIPVYPGIAMSQRFLTEEAKTLDKVYQQIKITRELGAGSFAIFSYSTRLRDKWFMSLGMVSHNMT